MCRKRGRIVLVGVTGLELSRADFYEKELTFQVSCSYGPGRYDPAYEDKGHDYPLGFVRWTEQRNFEAVLDLMAAGALDVEPLITHRFAIDEAGGLRAARLGRAVAGILLGYPERAGRGGRASLGRGRCRWTLPPARPATARPRVVGVIGAGNYAGRVLIPAFKAAGATLLTVVVRRRGVSGVPRRQARLRAGHHRRGGRARGRGVDTVVVATRHDTHAACRAARSRPASTCSWRSPWPDGGTSSTQIEGRCDSASGARAATAACRCRC